MSAFQDVILTIKNMRVYSSNISAMTDVSMAVFSGHHSKKPLLVKLWTFGLFETSYHSTSSNGIKSGEYVGKSTTLACKLCSIACSTPSTC